MKTMRITIGAVLALGMLSAAAPAPQQVAAARHAGFKKIGGAMKALGDQLKSDTPARPAMVAAAQTIATTARQQAALFPAGTGPDAGIKTDALPAIWSNRAAFDAQMRQFIAESGKLAVVAGNGDVAAIRAQMKATGATCAACHRQFRAED